MRKIKFRAWDTIKEKMIYGTDLKYVTWIDEFGELRSLGPIKLMQFTGLSDKNETPIYEGDILRASGYWDIKIVWDEANAKFGTTTVDWVVSQCHKANLNMAVLELFEVIGNIYENKELLNTVE